MKREAGESPARTRRCNRGVWFNITTVDSKLTSYGKVKLDVDTKVRRPACYVHTWTTRKLVGRRKKMAKKIRKIRLGLTGFMAIMGLFMVIYFNFMEKPVDGSKEIVIKVVNQENNVTTYEVKTDGKYLKDAMDEAKGLEYSGTESQYGIMVDTVNGVRADYTLDGAYWSFLVNDEYCNYGISEQPIEDGDVFSIVYTPVAE